MNITHHEIEVIGWVAISIAIFSSLAQFLYVNSTHNVESFAIEYIFLMVIIEFLWCIQGILKGSYTIAIAKGISCVYFAWLVYLAIKNNSHQGKKIKDLFFSSEKNIVKGAMNIFNEIKSKIGFK